MFVNRYTAIVLLFALFSCSDYDKNRFAENSEVMTACPSDAQKKIAVYVRNGKSGFMDGCGKIIIPAQFDMAFDFRGETALVQQNGLFGHLLQNGTFKIPARYPVVSFFSDGYAFVHEDTRRILIDNRGNEIAAAWSRSLISFFNGFGSFQCPDASGNLFILGQGIASNVKLCHDPNSREIDKNILLKIMSTPFCNGRGVVKEENTYKIIDTQGQIIKEFSFSEIKDGPFISKGICPHNQERAAPRPIRTIYAVDDCLDCTQGFIILRNVDAVVSRYNSKRAKNKKAGLFSIAGDVFIQPNYEDVMLFSDDRFALKKNGKWFLANKNAEQISDDKYNTALISATE